MPYVHVRMAGAPLTAEQIHALQQQITQLMAECLSKRHDLTAVFIEAADGLWTIGGTQQQSAAFLQAFITEGTNTAAEKAAFIAAAYACLQEAHGQTLSPASYVVVSEVPAEDWGYGGLTQAARRTGAN